MVWFYGRMSIHTWLLLLLRVRRFRSELQISCRFPGRTRNSGCTWIIVSRSSTHGCCCTTCDDVRSFLQDWLNIFDIIIMIKKHDGDYEWWCRLGSDRLKKEFGVPSVIGDFVGCIGASEPGAGSDVAGMKVFTCFWRSINESIVKLLFIILDKSSAWWRWLNHQRPKSRRFLALLSTLETGRLLGSQFWTIRSSSLGLPSWQLKLKHWELSRI